MNINNLWVVTKPTAKSTVQDICFNVDLPHGLYRQFDGGLNPDDVMALYDNQDSAEERARFEIRKIKFAA